MRATRYSSRRRFARRPGIWLLAGIAAATASLAAATQGMASTAHARGTDPDGAAGVISTVIGGAGGPGPATKVAIRTPCGIASSHQLVLFGDGVGAVRAVSERLGTLKTLAGAGVPSFTGDGHQATAAGLSSRICGLARDQAGDTLISDTGNNRVRLVPAQTGTMFGSPVVAGRIYTIAGGGSAVPGNGGPATSAALNPAGMTVDSSGNAVIADPGRFLVRVVAARTGTFYGQPMTAGDIYTIAGTGSPGFAGDGGPATSAVVEPDDVTFDHSGNLLIASADEQRIRVVAEHTGTFYGQPMTAGGIYTIAGTGTAGFAGDGGPARHAEFHAPVALTVDLTGNIVVADQANNRVRVIAARTGSFYGRAMHAGDIYTVAGGGVQFNDGAPGARAKLISPSGVAMDGSGNIAIADSGSQRVRVLAGRSQRRYSRQMIAGHIYVIAGTGRVRFSGDGGPARSAEAWNLTGIAVTVGGNAYVQDQLNARVRLVPSTSGRFFGRPMLAGHIYTVAGGGGDSRASGIPALKAAVNLLGIAADTPGNLLVANGLHPEIEVVAVRTGTFYGQHMVAGDIYPVAGGRWGFAGDGGPALKAAFSRGISGLTVDPATNDIVIMDSGNNHRIRMVPTRTGTFFGQPMTAGDIYTIAGANGSGFAGDGGPATSAELSVPRTAAFDGFGNLVIPDSGNNRIRVIAARTGTLYGQAMTDGDIYTIAGTGIAGFSGDGGPATSARLSDPVWTAIDGSGNVVVADAGNHRIRVIAAHTGTFYGQAMTAGDIYTITGTSTAAFTGDGGPATLAALIGPAAVAVKRDGTVLIADAGSDRIRAVTP